MNDTLKWVLLTLFSAIAVFAGGEALGVDWVMIQVSILSFVEMIGMLLLLFSGSAAAIEVATYFRRKNQALDAENTLAPSREISESDLHLMLREAVEQALETRLAETDEDRTALSPLSFDEEDDHHNQPMPTQRRQRQV